MTREEFKKSFNDVIQDPTKLDVATGLLNEVDNLFDAIALNEDNAAKATARIKELEERNQKLYLSVTGSAPDNDDDEDDNDLTGIDAMNAFWAKLDKEEK